MMGVRTGEADFGFSADGGTATRAAVAEPDPFAAAGVVGASPPAVAAPLLTPTWAAEAVIGLPQSMQNREVASFSRPQNEQTVNRHPPRRETHMAREYRSGFRDKPVAAAGWKLSVDCP